MSYQAGLLAATTAYVLSAIAVSKPRERVLIPADRPTTVVEPMRVDVLTSGGDRGIRIPENIGRGWCHEAGGMATYTFFVSADGEYTLWAYCLWGGVCTNAAYVEIDKSPKVLFGNDSHYGRWHWVRGTEWPLSRGTHTLKLSNHSDGIAIQRFLLLGDPTDRPVDGGAACYDLFYDGFDGCDGGNYATWHTSGEDWRLHEPLGKQDFEHRVLAGRAPVAGGPTVAVVGQNAWHNYSLAIKVRIESPGRLAMGFNYQDMDNCLVIEWLSASPRAPTTRVHIRQIVGGRSTLVGEVEATMKMNQWYEVDVFIADERLCLRMDGVIVGRVPFKGTLDGKLMLLLDDGASAWFDDVHVRLTETRHQSLRIITGDQKGIGCGQTRCKQ